MLTALVAPLSRVASAPRQNELIPDAEPEPDCVDNPSHTWIEYSTAEVGINNLGGKYNDSLPHYLEYLNVAKDDGKTLKLRVTAVNITTGIESDYVPSSKNIREQANGVGSDFFGVINIDSPMEVADGLTAEETVNYVDLKFCFVDDDDEPYVVDHFEFSILDLDSGKNTKNGGRPHECVTATGMENYVLADNTLLTTTTIDENTVQLCSNDEPGTIENPSDPMELTADQESVTVVLNYTNTDCFGIRIQSSCCANQGRNFLFMGETSVSPPICRPVTVHGDPIFKSKGSGKHFFMQNNVVVPLLKWTSPDGHQMSLHGVSLSNPSRTHQWLKEVIVKQDGVPVIETDAHAENIEGLGLAVKLDGKPMRGALAKTAGGVNMVSFANPDQKKWDRTVNVEAGGLSFEMVIERAKKFKDERRRERYKHINLRFPKGIPKGAEGTFAELSGSKPVSRGTKKMLRRSTAKKIAPPLR